MSYIRNYANIWNSVWNCSIANMILDPHKKGRATFNISTIKNAKYAAAVLSLNYLQINQDFSYHQIIKG